VSQTGLFNKHERADSHFLQSAIKNLKPCPERAKRVEWIGNIVVPVVQRIERRFPNAKTAFLHQFAKVVSSAQITEFKLVE